MITDYNRKLVGSNGELYRYGEGLVGVYTVSKRVARRVAAVTGAVKRQIGDYETTFSVPQNEMAALVKILKIKKLASLKRD